MGDEIGDYRSVPAMAAVLIASGILLTVYGTVQAAWGAHSVLTVETGSKQEQTQLLPAELSSDLHSRKALIGGTLQSGFGIAALIAGVSLLVGRQHVTQRLAWGATVNADGLLVALGYGGFGTVCICLVLPIYVGGLPYWVVPPLSHMLSLALLAGLSVCGLALAAGRDLRAALSASRLPLLLAAVGAALGSWAVARLALQIARSIAWQL